MLIQVSRFMQISLCMNGRHHLQTMYEQCLWSWKAGGHFTTLCTSACQICYFQILKKHAQLWKDKMRYTFPQRSRCKTSSEYFGYYTNRNICVKNQPNTSFLCSKYFTYPSKQVRTFIFIFFCFYPETVLRHFKWSDLWEQIIHQKPTIKITGCYIFTFWLNYLIILKLPS